MAFFGLFDKKTCAICGAEIGLLGNRKLEDGNCCKSCAAKLSPWFDERRHSTVEQIKEQLAYREENQKAVENFHITRTKIRGRSGIRTPMSSLIRILPAAARMWMRTVMRRRGR